MTSNHQSRKKMSDLDQSKTLALHTNAASSAVCWLNGRIVPLHDAHVSVFDRGLLYGDGVFEGIRFYQRRAFRYARHYARLRDSAQAIRLPLPYDAGALYLAIQDVIAEFAHADGYLRIVVTRGEGRLGLAPPASVQPNIFIIADELSLLPAAARRDGARLVIASTRRLPADGLDARIKSLNYLNHILARLEANNAGADEAILLNAAGHVTEGSADNIFIVRDGILSTPPVTDGALDGVTREAVLQLAQELGIRAQERTLAPYDLHTADECFLTGTALELAAVREIDGRTLRLCPGPIFMRLRDAFERLIARETRTTPY
jgi:branched-chain amino acid aminotransferase